jgi:DNA-binding response OmpR family regulator
MAIDSLQHTEPATQHTLLIVDADHEQRAFLAGQLDADGHTIYEADHAAAVLAKLSCHPVDVLILGELERPFETTALVRSVRAGEHQRVHPELPIITLGGGDELSALRAYESGSDHHLPASTGYVLLRAVIATVIRRVLEETAVRHLHADAIDVDLSARTVTVAGTPLHVSRLEFELLAKFAADPVRVFSKHELARCIWRGRQISQRTVDSHICRLRGRLTAAGAGLVLVTRWGQGWALTSPTDHHAGSGLDT